MSDQTPTFNTGTPPPKPRPRNALERFFQEARSHRESEIERALYLINRNAIEAWKAEGR